MKWIKSIAGPFAGSRASAARKRLWAAALLGAPLALAAGVWLQQRHEARREWRIEMGREAALATARKAATKYGLTTEGWTEVVRLAPRSDLDRYFQGKGLAATAGPRLLAPSMVATALLAAPDGRQWCSVSMGPAGNVTAYKAGGRGFLTDRQEASEESAREVAENALSEILGDIALERLGEPEVSITQEAEVPGARRFTWRALPRRLPELEYIVRVDVSGTTLVGAETEAVLAESFRSRVLVPLQEKRQFSNSVRGILIALLVIYACYRYARRAREKEAPHGRSLLLGAGLVGFGAALLASDPFATAGQLKPEQLHGPQFWLLVLLTLLLFGVQGLLLGVGYGAGEGEVRERYKGKLRSLDALLAGRLFSRNAGAAVVGGVALACWVYCLSGCGQALLRAESMPMPSQSLGLAYSRYPVFVLLFNLPILTLFNSVLGLLAPITFFGRHVKSKALQRAGLVVVALTVGNLAAPLELTSPYYWLGAVCLVGAMLGPFFALDYLAGVAGAATFGFLTLVGELAVLTPFLRGNLSMMGWIAGVAVLGMAVAAWRGKWWKAEDVAPAHARNLAERLSLEAELGVAREAQLRLLPQRMPEISGLSIAASCVPAREMGGDYYDFFELPRGRLGMVVAEGGNDGLAAALTIGLAKGFLMYEASMGSSIQATMAGLEETLGENLRRESGETSLALFTVDGVGGVLQMARLGAYPRLLVLSRDGGVTEVAPKPHRAGQPLETVRAVLQPGDSVLIYTDGLPRLLTLLEEGTPQDLLRRIGAGPSSTAARLHELVLERLIGKGGKRQRDLADDLTAVVVRYEAVERARIEDVA
ncbi:MAG: SpoIIE family protein phosphatase [Acidobacteria bacterium]|nr:SpoIIE family protein phosphatase [Acidobacteriota bacterium]